MISILSKIKKFISIKILKNYKYNSQTYVEHLKRLGVKIGSNVFFNQLESVNIDITRPCLVEIGNNVRITKGFTLLTHDYSWFVLRNFYSDIVPSSGKVKIGNNIFIGFNATILSNVEIGDNCIIASGCVVTKSIPKNSVVAGVPARVICSLDEFYEKRKLNSVNEAIEYAQSIRERYNREPKLNDFTEEFSLFLDGGEIPEQLEILIQKQLGPVAEKYHRSHKKIFSSFDEFLSVSKRI